MFPINNRLAWRTIVFPAGWIFEGMFDIELLRLGPAAKKKVN